MTVQGAIAPDQMGVTMPHEHIVCDISIQSGKEDNRLDNIDLCISEVIAFKQAGGSTLVDVTPEDIGRDPLALKRVSEATDVHIITTTGYYSERLYPKYIVESSTADLAARMVREVTDGIGNTGIRPGIIGELGSHQAHVTPAEEHVLRAAARTHLATGLAITLHSSLDRPAPKQLALLQEEGVSPERVIVSHADIVWHEDIAQDLDYFLPLLDAGCYLGFDTIGWKDFSPEPERIKRLCVLIEKGYVSRLLLSSDLCRRSFYHAYGGRGYDYVLRSFVPKLKARGISDSQIATMLTDNPREILSY